MKPTYLLLACLAVTLAACGKSEAPPAAPAAEAPEPVVETPPPLLDSPPVEDTLLSEPAPETESSPLPVPAITQAPPKPAPATESARAPVTAPADTPAPQAEVVAVAPPPPANLAAGRTTYQQACAFCHDRGVANAPKIGDAGIWSSRLAQVGLDALYTVALRGKGAMPAKGGNPSLSDGDVKAAVDYMIAQSR